MLGGLDDGCQVDVRWSGYVSPLGGNQSIIWMSSICPIIDT